MGFAVGMKVEGLQQLANELTLLSVDIHDKALRSAIRTVAKKAAKEAQAILKPGEGERTGALREAVAIKMLTRKGSTALLGVDDRPRMAGGKTIDPGKYAHLVELGHVTRNGGRTRPIPFLSGGVKKVEPKARVIVEGRLNSWLRRYKT